MIPSEDEYFGNLALKGFQQPSVPDSIQWLPLAPGWYLLGLIVVMLAAWKMYEALKKYQANAYRREALSRQQWLNKKLANGELSTKTYLQSLRQLIKATALRAYPRTEVAALSGSDWQVFLNSKIDKACFSDATQKLMDATVYQQQYEPDQQLLKDFSSSVSRWITQHHAIAQMESKQ